jgi:hypothetical protein
MPTAKLIEDSEQTNGSEFSAKGAGHRYWTFSPRTRPWPPIEQQVLGLVRLGLKVHDIAGLLGVHPRVVVKARIVTPA